MLGLVPSIHAFIAMDGKAVDGRHKADHDAETIARRAIDEPARTP
jgi:hypothetical protein